MATSWALISGASTGIGRATALQLAGHGFHVLAGVRSQAAGEALASAASGPGRVLPILLDVTDQASIAAATARAEEEAGAAGLRVVMNNAGIVVPGPVEFVTAAEWRQQFDVNFFGMIELTRATLPLLRRGAATHGAFVPRLLFISSIGGRVSQPVLAPYTTSKFATTALGDALRLELRRQGIGGDGGGTGHGGHGDLAQGRRLGCTVRSGSPRAEAVWGGDRRDRERVEKDQR